MSEANKKARVFIRCVEDRGQSVLEFKDNEGHGWKRDITTDIEAGSTIDWKSESGIKEITAVNFKDTSIFEAPPAPVNKTKFQAIVKAGISGLYSYTVSCKLDTDEELSHDPDLNVKN